MKTMGKKAVIGIVSSKLMWEPSENKECASSHFLRDLAHSLSVIV
jgi:hypothetical protein